MSRTTTMATGFFLILIGVQLHLVESFTLTPRVAHFLNDNFPQATTTDLSPVPSENFSNPPQPFNSPYYQASFDRPTTPSVGIRTVADRRIAPPRWFCWPVFFLGAFLLIQGLSQSQG